MSKSKDFIFSILSNIVLMLLLQMFLIPVYSKGHTTKEFGEFILILTLVNIISPILGNSLNNIRLIKKNDDSLNENGYTTTSLIGFLLVLIITFLCVMNKHFTLIDSIYASLWSGMLLVRSYLFVYYRIDFRFKSLLYISISASFIMFLGVLAVYFYDVSIFSVLFASEFTMTILMFLDYRKKFHKFEFEFLNSEENKNYFELIGANSVLNLINYSDRILISVFLGTTYVPLFFVATILGKISNMLINPIVTVLLSYEVNDESKNNYLQIRKTFKLILLVSFILTIFITIASWIFIFLFYNEYLNKVVGLIFLANLGVILMSSSAVLQMKLVANSLFRQNLLINMITLIIIVAFSFILVKFLNIYGYTFALIIAAIFKHFAVYNNISKTISSKRMS
ncbi:capsular biosynthesis protein [Staphylococcus haemolyticus]|uniref:lipopolysaccharide biosynthesis protein n=3 Tax=Staphylococcus haemolyticus TaxID=1283 RepID=UPI0004A8F731|nr:capsular biosynthesis protein [Staphylococcus haemolyticus]KDP49140.1 polysaccharide biosynthesis protein [Staphylococcus aureus subsp. aureus CO-98]AKC75183.1 hypothetical protein ShL2_00301 [Staphylococcus haemolyticus]MBK3954940.1 capsular biosynthesis protein [Staphylococcus haemolyticus]MBV5129887.1 capsular biosynthesis protein [Staphylococcus haemolyticus]MBV6665738.1 capsular biosynthesis protein [Staphylococcus haemolyticus]